MKQTRILKTAVLLALMLGLMTGTVSAAYSPDTLYLGKRGELVRAMQSGLLFIGFQIEADGVFGEKTENAVLAFQKQQNLTADGLAGRKTLDVLYALAPQFKPDSITAPAAPETPAKPNPVQDNLPKDTGNAQVMYVHTQNRGSLNLRSRPSGGHTTFAQLPFGTQVTVLSTQSGWAKVEALGQTGYVMSSFLRQDPGKTPAATPPPQKPEQPIETGSGTTAQVITANKGSLNLRSRASYSGIVLVQIPYAANVNVLSTSGQWSKITYQARTGYVISSFLKTANSQPPKATPAVSQKPPVNPPVSGQTAVVNNAAGRTLNFRSAPAEGNNIIGQIPSGTSLPLISRGTDWCEVTFQGVRGFVMSSFLKFDNAASPTVTPAPEPEPPLEEEIKAEEIFPRVLRAGMKGADVKELQTRLAALKYTVSINSSYDAMTVEAVSDFQKQNSLKVDGVFGGESAQVLLGGSARKATDPQLTFGTLRIDNRSAAVTEMQKALKALGYPLNVNGQYDIPTHQAVVAFQQRNGLPITGVANPITQSTIFSSSAKDYSVKVSGISASEGKGGGPSSSQVKLLPWFTDVKKSASGGQYATIYHPGSDSSFKIRFYSIGNHADSEPATWKDTQIMNRAFGVPSWNINTVYVKLPDGRWTLAAMHNRPHLTGAVSANGFGGHLCIHFLRDIEEVNRNDPDYGASNQRAIRKAWQALTGEVVE